MGREELAGRPFGELAETRSGHNTPTRYVLPPEETRNSASFPHVGHSGRLKLSQLAGGKETARPFICTDKGESAGRGPDCGKQRNVCDPREFGRARFAPDNFDIQRDIDKVRESKFSYADQLQALNDIDPIWVYSVGGLVEVEPSFLEVVRVVTEDTSVIENRAPL